VKRRSRSIHRSDAFSCPYAYPETFFSILETFGPVTMATPLWTFLLVDGETNLSPTHHHRDGRRLWLHTAIELTGLRKSVPLGRSRCTADSECWGSRLRSPGTLAALAAN
jgi:hypothetical protein